MPRQSWQICVYIYVGKCLRHLHSPTGAFLKSVFKSKLPLQRSVSWETLLSEFPGKRKQAWAPPVQTALEGSLPDAAPCPPAALLGLPLPTALADKHTLPKTHARETHNKEPFLSAAPKR